VNYIIDFDEIESKERFVRTNNICERYNERLLRKIGIKHPWLSVVISMLLQEEDLYKTKILGNMSQAVFNL